jgi:signal recognition particle subunit SRP54
MSKMGPLQKVLGMIPGMSYQLPEADMEKAEERLDKWKVIIRSMTIEEKEDPKVINSSRMKRIARGSGTSEADVRELIKNHENMKKMFKQMKGNRRLRNMPFKMLQR